MLGFVGPNFLTPPSSPPSSPPLAPPNSPGLGGAALGGLGLGLGNFLGEQFLNNFFGQSPNIVPPGQEQQAINNAQNPGRDQQIQAPPLFQGGQAWDSTYQVTWVTKWINQIHGLAKIYSRQTMVGRVTTNIEPGLPDLIGGNRPQDMYRRPYSVLPNGSIDYGQNFLFLSYTGYTLTGTNTYAGIEILEIIPLSPPSDEDNFPPGIISPGGTPGLGPITFGLNTPPLTNNAPRTSPSTNTTPGTSPGTNTDPRTNPNPGFDPLGNTAPSPSPNPLTHPGTNPNPGTSPGTNTTPGTSAPGRNTNLLPPLFLPPGLNGQTGQNTNFSPSPTPTAPSVNTQPSGCETGCVAPVIGKLNDQDRKFDDLGNKLDVINAGANAGQLAQLNEVLDRLGPKVNGGLSGFLKGKFEKLWESKMVDRALSIMNLAASIHNAVMLSKNIGETLVATFTNVLALIGIKDPDGQTSTFTQAIGNTIEGFLKGIVGAENYTELTTTWKKANRIYQAAINTYQLLTDSLFAVAEGLELIGKYTGKMGNALKKSGTVLENSYEWFGETFNFKSKRNRAIDQVIQGLRQGQEVASDLQEITENFREAQENITEIGEQINTVKSETQTQVTEKTTKETMGKTNSQTPDIPKSAINQPSPPPT